MANHLTKFDTQSQYEQFKNTSDFVKPNVTYCEGDNQVYYAPDNVIIITFIFNNKQYQAEEGMTWQQWVNSNYNIDGFYIYNDYVLSSASDNVETSSNIEVISSDFIINGESYHD